MLEGDFGLDSLVSLQKRTEKYIRNKDQNSIILITGSIYLISEAIKLNT